jgi:hypothetical protein
MSEWWTAAGRTPVFRRIHYTPKVTTMQRTSKFAFALDGDFAGEMADTFVSE